MADIKKLSETESAKGIKADVKTEKKAQEIKAGGTNAPVTAAAKSETKPVAKKSAAKSATKKPVAKKPTAKVAKATKAETKKEKSVAKKSAARNAPRKEVIDSTDKIKTALWKAISKSKAKKINGVVAIQIIADGADDFDSFYVAVKDGQPEIERYYYNNNDGELFTSEAELIKIAKGKYDIVSAAKSGKVKFDGNLSSLLKMIDLF